jgi:flavin-dependent dehydrogenase
VRIQIYGAGIAGSYLYYLLSDEGFEVSVKDRRGSPDCRCGWGLIYSEAKELYRLIGVNVDEYIITKPEHVVINGMNLKNKNVVIFDKRRLLEDLWKDIRFGEDSSDLKIDATGIARAILPPIENDRLFPTFQCIERQEMEENIYIYLTKTGYAWAFPLENSNWHIGAGDINAENIESLICKLKEKYGFKRNERTCNCSGKIRMLQPSKCKPFLHKNIVGVGEAIGCVSGSGEGNVPALHSAKLLYECIVEDRLDEYERRIAEELNWIEVEQKFVDAMLKNSPKMLIYLPRIIAIERNRTVEHSVSDLRKIMGI